MRACKWTKGQIALLVRSAQVTFDRDADPALREAARWVADELVREFLPDARKLVRRYTNGYTSRLRVEGCDQESLAHDAVLAAIRRFRLDGTSDACFVTVLTWKVRGAVSCHLRARNAWKRKAFQIICVPALDNPRFDPFASNTAVHDADPFASESDDADRVRTTLAGWLRSRDDKQRMWARIISLRYREGMIFPQIARVMGFSKQWAHVVHADAIEHLREAVAV